MVIVFGKKFKYNKRTFKIFIIIRDRTDLIHFSKRIASCKIYGISLWRFLQNISKNWILDIHSKYCPQNQTIVEVKHLFTSELIYLANKNASYFHMVIGCRNVQGCETFRHLFINHRIILLNYHIYSPSMKETTKN